MKLYQANKVDFNKGLNWTQQFKLKSKSCFQNI